MDFDINALIAEARTEAELLSYLPKESAPSFIVPKTDVVIKKGQIRLIADLFTGLENVPNLLVKLPGTCQFYPYDSSKTVIIGEEDLYIHFRIGENGDILEIVFPVASN